MLKKGLKITLVVVIGVIVLGIAAFYILQANAANELRSRINKHLVAGVDFDFRQLDFDLFEGTFVLHDMRLQRIQDDTLQWRIEAGRVKITGFGYQYTGGEHGISASSFEVHYPKLHVHVSNPDFQVFESDSLNASEGKQRLGYLAIDTLHIDSGRVDFSPAGAEEAWGHVNAGMGGFRYMPSGKNPAWTSASLDLHDLGYHLSNGVYILRAAKVDVDWKTRGAEVHGFSMKSTMGKEAFQKHYGHRKSRIDLEAPYLHLAGFSIDSADTYHLQVMRLGNASILLSRDNSLPLPERVTKLPQTMLDELPMRLHLHRLQAENAALTVELKGKRSQELETLRFTEIQIDLQNIQNANQEVPAMEGRASGRFMDDTVLDVDLIYTYGYGDPWNLQAVVGKFDMTKLNNLIESEVGMVLSSGHMTELFMNLDGNKDLVEGELIFHYEDLHIVLAEERREESSIFYRYLVEGIGKLFYRKENPDKQDSRSAEFSVERDVRKEFIGQWIDGLTEGMLITVSKIDAFAVKQKSLERKLKKSERRERKEQRRSD